MMYLFKCRKCGNKIYNPCYNFCPFCCTMLTNDNKIKNPNLKYKKKEGYP